MKFLTTFLIVMMCPLTVLAEPLPSSEAKILSAQGGRFVFGQISEMRRDQYMLDTQTGRLWRITETKASNVVLEPVVYSLLNGKVDLVPNDSSEEKEDAAKPQPKDK